MYGGVAALVWWQLLAFFLPSFRRKKKGKVIPSYRYSRTSIFTDGGWLYCTCTGGSIGVYGTGC